MSAPLLLVPLVTVLASLLLVSQPAQPLSIIKKVFESKSFYLVFIADGHRLELLTINRFHNRFSQSRRRPLLFS